MGLLAIGVEQARQAQRAQGALDREGRADPPGLRLEEPEVEGGVVGDESGALEPAGEFGEGDVGARRTTEVAAADAVDVRRPDRPEPSLPRVRAADERGVGVEDRAVGVDHDDAELEDAVPIGAQSARLDVDDGEPFAQEPGGVLSHDATSSRGAACGRSSRATG